MPTLCVSAAPPCQTEAAGPVLHKERGGMSCGLWKKTGKEPGCVVHPGSFLLRRGGRGWGNGVSELPSRRLPISQRSWEVEGRGRGKGGSLSPERFLPSPGSPFSIQTFHKNIPPGYAPDRPADPRGPTSGIGGSVRHDTQRLTARLHQRQLPPVAVNAPADDGRSQCPGTAGRLGVGRPGPADPYKRRNPQAGRFTMKPDAPGGILTQQPETGK